jgi:hypothetical protein
MPGGSKREGYCCVVGIKRSSLRLHVRLDSRGKSLTFSMDIHLNTLTRMFSEGVGRTIRIISLDTMWLNTTPSAQLPATAMHNRVPTTKA